MKFKKALPWLALLAVVAAGIHWFSLTQSQHSEAETGKDESPTQVEVSTIQRKTIGETLTAYGSVIAQPSRIQVVAVSFETCVSHILVAPGQAVRKGDPLVEIEPSVAAQLQLHQAMNAAAAAKRALEQTRSRFSLKLATNQDLDATQTAEIDTQLQLTSLQQAGLGTDNRVRSTLDGIVAKVDVQDGQIVATGGALVETIAADDIEVKLGIETEDVSLLKERTGITITPVQGGRTIQGRVRLITHRTNNDTRLVDVYVSLPRESGLLLDSYVSGSFQRIAEQALVVPRAALQSDEHGYCVFTVHDNKAVRQPVQPGIVSGGEIEVTGTGPRQGDTVVTVGSHELSDGDEVRTQTTGGAQDQ